MLVTRQWYSQLRYTHLFIQKDFHICRHKNMCCLYVAGKSLQRQSRGPTKRAIWIPSISETSHMCWCKNSTSNEYHGYEYVPYFFPIFCHQRECTRCLVHVNHMVHCGVTNLSELCWKFTTILPVDRQIQVSQNDNLIMPYSKKNIPK